MKDEILLEKACELTDLANQLSLIDRLIESLDYNLSLKNDFTAMYQLKTGILGDLGDSVTRIKNKIETISNDICPPL